MNNTDGQTIWGRLVGILIFVIAGLLLGWGFLVFQNTNMSQYGFDNVPNIAGQIVTLDAELAAKQNELEEIKKSEQAVRYDIAKYIENEIPQSKWSDYINSLIQMYREVRSISSYSEDAIELSDFLVDQTRIALRGKVRTLNTIYKDGGVIDRLVKLHFLHDIQIPSYQKIDNVYEFQIQSKVSTATAAATQ